MQILISAISNRLTPSKFVGMTSNYNIVFPYLTVIVSITFVTTKNVSVFCIIVLDNTTNSYYDNHRRLSVVYHKGSIR